MSEHWPAGLNPERIWIAPFKASDDGRFIENARGELIMEVNPGIDAVKAARLMNEDPKYRSSEGEIECYLRARK